MAFMGFCGNNVAQQLSTFYWFGDSSMSLALLLLLVAASPPADDLTQPAPPAKAAATARHEKHGSPADIPLAEIIFADRRVSDVFTQLDASARKLVQAGWANQGTDNYKSLGWHTDEFSCNWSRDPSYSPTSERHSIRLQTPVRLPQKESSSFGLFVDKGLRSSWSVELAYRMEEKQGQVGESFGLTFHHFKLAAANYKGEYTRADLNLGLGNCRREAKRRDQDYSYCVNATSEPLRNASVEPSTRKELQGYLASPASFRTTALAELARWEANIRSDAIDGPFGIHSVVETHARASDQPPLQVAGVPLPAKLKDEMRAELLGVAAAHRKLVEDHHADMHQVLVAAFPDLAKILENASKR